MKINVACIQMNATTDVAANIAWLEPMIRKAAADGADLIATPENTNFQIAARERVFATAKSQDEDTMLSFLQRMARDTKKWILVGSLAVQTGEDRLANRSFMISDKGEIGAVYDKIHMFDVDLGPNLKYQESENFRPGNRAVLAQTPWCTFGMTVCYDLRFPLLYRSLAHAGASILTVPAAFTAVTGAMHWHVLLRARAIENGCFVIAPAQCGTRDGNRQTYGHAMIVAPDGRILAEAGEEPGMIMAELDLNEVATMRDKIPSLQHDRQFDGPASPL